MKTLSSKRLYEMPLRVIYRDPNGELRIRLGRGKLARLKRKLNEQIQAMPR